MPPTVRSGRHARQRDRARQRRRKGAAGDLAVPGAGRDALVRAQHRAFVQQQPKLRVARRRHCAQLERRAADEFADRRLEGHRPPQARLERCVLSSMSLP
jgi:hypothetical protein